MGALTATLSVPQVTVLMPVYNGSKYLEDAIESILRQTYSHFEFLIINDGSTDDTPKILKSFAQYDKRIRLVNRDANHGLTSCLNLGLKIAMGRFIARMDADDISLPERIERQISFMENNPSVGICGSSVRWMENEKETISQFPQDHKDIVCHNLFAPALAHPSVIMRKDALAANSLKYSTDYLYAQDYEFWTRCSRHMQMANLNEILLVLRRHGDQISMTKNTSQLSAARAIREEQLKGLDIIPSEDEKELHEQISCGAWKSDRSFLMSADTWMRKIITSNKTRYGYPEPALSTVLANKWHVACAHATSLGLWTWTLYIHSPLSAYYSGDAKDRLSLAVRCLLRKGYWRTTINR